MQLCCQPGYRMNEFEIRVVLAIIAFALIVGAVACWVMQIRSPR